MNDKEQALCKGACGEGSGRGKGKIQPETESSRARSKTRKQASMPAHGRQSERGKPDHGEELGLILRAMESYQCVSVLKRPFRLP